MGVLGAGLPEEAHRIVFFGFIGTLTGFLNISAEKDLFFGTLTGFLKVVVGKARFFVTLTGFLNMFKENL